MKTAIILTIGDEILLGQITDTNSQWLSDQLSMAGFEIPFRISAGDDRERIEEALRFSFRNADVVLLTGGLGPTRDDITKKILADWFGTTLEQHPLALAHLQERMSRRGRPMNELVLTQALHPKSAEYLENKVGTAPGIWFSEKGKICIALPGVPYEMKQLFSDEVMPRLREKLKLSFVQHRFIRTVGVPETHLALRIQDLEEQFPPGIRLAYLPSGGQVKLRLTAKGENEALLKVQLEKAESGVFERISDHVYAREDVELEQVVTRLLLDDNQDLVVSDSLTEGRLGYLLSQNHAFLPHFQQMPGVPMPAKGFYVRIFSEPDETGSESQSIEVSRFYSGKEVDRRKTRLRPFPMPEVNRNMLSLWTLDLLRRMVLESPKNLAPQTP